MIKTLLRVAWIQLKRDRAALFLTFVLPIIFFSIFSVVFGQMGTGGSASISYEAHFSSGRLCSSTQSLR